MQGYRITRYDYKCVCYYVKRKFHTVIWIPCVNLLLVAFLVPFLVSPQTLLVKKWWCFQGLINIAFSYHRPLSIAKPSDSITLDVMFLGWGCNVAASASLVKKEVLLSPCLQKRKFVCITPTYLKYTYSLIYKLTWCWERVFFWNCL